MKLTPTILTVIIAGIVMSFAQAFGTDYDLPRIATQVLSQSTNLYTVSGGIHDGFVPAYTVDTCKYYGNLPNNSTSVLSGIISRTRWAANLKSYVLYHSIRTTNDTVAYTYKVYTSTGPTGVPEWTVKVIITETYYGGAVRTSTYNYVPGEYPIVESMPYYIFPDTDASCYASSENAGTSTDVWVWFTENVPFKANVKHTLYTRTSVSYQWNLNESVGPFMDGISYPVKCLIDYTGAWTVLHNHGSMQCPCYCGETAQVPQPPLPIGVGRLEYSGQIRSVATLIP